MDEPTVDDILRALEKHEEAMAALYAALGERLADTKSLWDRLVLEENAHADVVGTLRRQLRSRRLIVNTRKFNTAALRTSTAFIEERVKEIEARGITQLRALSLASGVEHAIIEKEFYTVVESDSTEMKKEFQALHEHTIRHRALIDEYLEAERRKIPLG